ncbi:unnamed protein product [Adineta steineri]|uniref:NAD(P)(+)--arginine ADP-ribosyltransferase n=1 Tax=Adineta steineri TaxID=433720 RepID=A0A819KQ43_9BILA|nr:unnamed protein product [Adineta steineri]
MLAKLNSDKETSKVHSASKDISTCRRTNGYMIENALLIWLNYYVDKEDNDVYRRTIKNLERIMNRVKTCNNNDSFLQLLDSIQNETVFIVMPGYFAQDTVPIIHTKSYLDSIYILCGDKGKHQKWAKQWAKIKGIFTQIPSIYEVLKETARQWEENAISISFSTINGEYISNEHWEQLDNLKEIFLTIDFEEKQIQEFIYYCRQEFAGDDYEQKNILQFEQEYHNRTPIWWYTNEGFVYPMLNFALRTLNINMIIRMGFFICDLHRQIKQLHSKQFANCSSNEIFIVYRGQGISKKDFEKITETKDGLISFNTFLSTSKDREMSLKLAQQSTLNLDYTGVLFNIMVDPSQSTTSFASIHDVSYLHEEDEILFSMNTLFRIDNINSISENNRLYEVKLILINDTDPDLCRFTPRARYMITPEVKGWFKLNRFLVTMGRFDEAEELYELLLNETTNENVKGYIYEELGWDKDFLGQYQEAITLYEKAVDIYQKLDPSNNLSLANVYTNIGTSWMCKGDLHNALSFHEKALAIRKQSLPLDHSNLVSTYYNIGSIYMAMNDYSKALSSYEKGLEIQQQSLPANHLDITDTYDKIGMMHFFMRNFSQALSFYEKAFEIRQQSDPLDDLRLAKSYRYFSTLYYEMNDPSKAHSSALKALELEGFDENSEEFMRACSFYNSSMNNRKS